MIVMDMNTGKVLDEACNCFNEVYRDEVLYTSWIERLQTGSATAGAVPANANATGFGSRLYTRQE
jgi:hypothetical protein